MPENKPIQIEVGVLPDGSPHCGDKEIVRVRRGARLQWIGVPHRGEFRGKIRGPKTDGLTKADIRAMQFDIDNTVMPATVSRWLNDQIVTVTGPKGVYKYSIFVGDKELDPVIIIDDPPDAGGDG